MILASLTVSSILDPHTFLNFAMVLVRFGKFERLRFSLHWVFSLFISDFTLFVSQYFDSWFIYKSPSFQEEGYSAALFILYDISMVHRCFLPE